VIDGRLQRKVNLFEVGVFCAASLRYSRAAPFAATAASINAAPFTVLPVLRGFSRSAKQDSVGSKVTGGVSEANVAFLPRSSASVGKTDSER
jgi:hypothetical protein